MLSTGHQWRPPMDGPRVDAIPVRGEQEPKCFHVALLCRQVELCDCSVGQSHPPYTLEKRVHLGDDALVNRAQVRQGKASAGVEGSGEDRPEEAHQQSKQMGPLREGNRKRALCPLDASWLRLRQMDRKHENMQIA